MGSHMGQRCVGLWVAQFSPVLRGTGTQESPLQPEVESRDNCKIWRVHLEVTGIVEGAAELILRVHPRKVPGCYGEHELKDWYLLCSPRQSQEVTGISRRSLWNSGRCYQVNLLSTLKCEKSAQQILEMSCTLVNTPLEMCPIGVRRSYKRPN